VQAMVHELELPTKNTIHNYFLISDIHSLYADIDALKIFFNHLALMPPAARSGVIVGDLFDMEYFMDKKGSDFRYWLKEAHGVDEYFYPEYEKEVIIWGNQFFDRLEQLGCEVHYMLGNHDERLYLNFLPQCPNSQRHLFNLARDLDLDKRNVKMYRYPSFLDIGDVSLMHGHRHNVKYLRDHVLDANYRSIICGHMHRDEKESYKSRSSAAIKGQSLPCMCDLNPDYLKGKPNNWTKGYGQLVVYSNGKVQLHIHNIVNNTVILPETLRVITPNNNYLK
jgi:UDP-2,3-diacylglucosamine pyrophosphatase LpxH